MNEGFPEALHEFAQGAGLRLDGEDGIGAPAEGVHVLGPLPNSPRDFDLILKRAGIRKNDELGRKLTAHSFRHSYATLMAEATGHNPFVLKEILGHKRLSTTERYCHLEAPALAVPWKEITPFAGERGVGSGCRIFDVASDVRS